MHTPKVLVVSGSAEMAGSMAAMLGVTGDEIVALTDGAEAFRRVWDDDYEVIVTELGMPGIDGRDLYMAFQNTWPELTRRMVFVCATPTEPMVDFASRTGVPVLCEPFSLVELRAAVQAVRTPRRAYAVV
jgi:two-component system NtrC family sensor kinase